MADKTIFNNNLFSLNDTETLKKNNIYSIEEVMNIYVRLVFEYINFITENTKYKKSYFKFILLRGLETITNVFNLIFYYTKNLDITYFHSQKAFYFYIEFIEQINNDKNSFLQLSSRDAILYVYKKTIFLINDENRKNANSLNQKDKHFFSSLNKYIIINKLFFSKLLSEDLFLDMKEKNILLEKIRNINCKINSISFLQKKEKLESILIFININFNIKNNLDTFLELFLKELL